MQNIEHVLYISTGTVFYLYAFSGHVILKRLIIHTILHTEHEAHYLPKVIPAKSCTTSAISILFYFNAKIVFPLCHLLSIYTLNIYYTAHFHRLRLYNPRDRVVYNV
jgi:hypothetical protein